MLTLQQYACKIVKLGGKIILKIAFLGWGSLVWNPDKLKISGTWQEDGPCLPIEFARISEDKRLTLVLYPNATKVKTMWARAVYKDLEEAICELAKREGTATKYIGFVCIPDDKSHCKAVPDVLSIIKAWAKQKKLDAAVWTDLPPKFPKEFTPENVIQYLKKLEVSVLCDAEIYVRNAPRQIRTKIRELLEEEFGWTPVNTQEKHNWSKFKEDLEERIVDKSPDNSYWIVVPEKPATFGHLLVISWRGYQEQDIADKGLFKDRSHMQEAMRMIHDIVFQMKSCLTSNGKANGKKCEKVYLVSECETKDFPFHFHLIPRFEREEEGHLNLFIKELEEARWMTDDEKEVKTQDGFVRIGKAEGILDYHRQLLQSDRWAKDNKKREKEIGRMMKWWKEHWVSAGLDKKR